MKDYVDEHITRAWVSVDEHSWTVVEIFCDLKNELHAIVLSQTVIEESLLKNNRVITSRDIVFLPWIDASLNGDSSSVPASHKIQSSKVVTLQKKMLDSVEAFE